MRSGHPAPAVLIPTLVAALLLAVAIGVASGHALAALAIAACGETAVLAWLLLRRPAHRARTSGDDTARPPAVPHSRWRRLAAQLRDVRDAVNALPDAVVLLDHDGHVRWFNAAAGHLLGLRRPLGAPPLATRLADSEFGAWLREGARPLAGDLPAPGEPTLRLSAASMPFGTQLQLLLARDISTVSRLEQVRR
jgi:two-component system phosphate regulon sensor histidine kinase PhoR